MQISWKTLFNDAKPFKNRIITGQIIALFAVIISLPIPLLFPMLIDEVLLNKPSWILASIDSFYQPSETYYYILIIFATTLLLRIVFFALNVMQIRIFTKVSKSIVFSLRERLLMHLEKVSVAEYEALGGGGVSSKLVTDINTIDDFIGVSIGKFLISSFSLIGVSIVLLMINWQLAIILLILNPTVITLTSLLGKKIRKLKKKENLNIEIFQNALSETLDLFIQIRTHNQEKRYIATMIENARAIRDASSNFGWKSEAAGQFAGVVFLLGFEILRATAMVMVLFSQLSIGEMFAVMGYLWFMITPLQDLLGILFSYQNAKSALERLNDILILQHEPQYRAVHNPFEASSTNAIRLKNVSFSYGDKEVLHQIDMDIPKAKTVALLGSSGSGKSTLAHIILGLYSMNEGEIYIDGLSIKEIGLDTLRDHIALVLQSPRMFNDTLRHNLTLGRDIDDDTLYEALHIAQLGAVISKLQKGLDTKIGKEGIRLSGGERQRLAIARMLVFNPNIIILDESTSALDIQTENHLFASLRDHLKGKTMIIIAHRLSTIEHADLVYVIKEGRVVESGVPQELLQNSGHFSDFVTAQQ
ncbi:MAG: ABC transporter ATP-binding protein [Campylobacterota bacterium]|nr:ABC transporter ATP-binding protein [Campylobacterota bacterium]